MSNQGSQSNSNTWELSHYELHRKPHETVTDNSAIAVSPRALHSELMCPICLDLMKNTLTTKECLHRFCQECIITALRSGNKECPTCRKKLISKRSLRADPNFDALISKVYPNRDELNAQQEKSQSRRNAGAPVKRKRKAAATDTPSPEREGSQQPEPKKVKTTVEPETQETTPEPTVHQIDEVELQLRPHPNDPSVANHTIRNLSTSGISTVSHLVKFLSVHTVLEEEKKEKGGTAVRALSFDGGRDHNSGDRKYILYIPLGADEELSILPSGTSLKQICDTYWTPGDKLKLYFAIDDRLAAS